PLRWERRARWEPRDFWPDPEYPGLAEYDHASQIDLLLETRAAWPESLWIELAWSGTLYDSLRPPRENYQRGFETTRGLIDPRGAYLSGYSLWYPRRFDPPSPFSLSVDLPAGWMAVSQGRMVEGPNGERTAGSPRAGDDAADPSGAGDRAAEPPGARDAAGAASAAWDPPGAGLRRMTWDSPEPMDEIYLVAGPYTLREADHRGIAIQTFTYGRDDEELCRTYLAATGEYLDLYDDLIGPYPFPKFALVENFWQTGYGMPSFTLLGDRVLRLPFIVKTSYGHEILHNWWGNGVYVDTAEGNWCEGLTVYGADYLYKERESEAAAREYRRNQLQGYLDYVRHGRDFPLTEFRERHDAASAAIGYGKSMMLFHMLRRRLGDEAFRAGLRDFYERHLFRGATWDDLLAALAAGGEFDPEAFRAQWIERPGAPLLTLEEVDLSFSRTGGVELRYRLTQSEPLYDLAVPVRASFPDRTAESWVVKLSGPAHEETRLLQATPISLEVDPDFDICRRLHRAEVPATLSRLFGADSLTVVAGGGAGEGGGGAGEGDEAFAEICARLAGELPGQTTALRSDEELGWFDLRSSAWLLGEPRWMARVREAAPRLLALDGEGFCIGEDVFSYTTHTLACVLGHPGVPDAAVGLLLGGDPGDWPEIWRRLPHYGSYSYLVFEGGRNVAKGAWPVERSPLKVVWEGGQ
ncbi:MAG: hypothetical protein FJY75_09755, partial [Candidatus Eisenbacteria bacterium]|nr:hypothetical protein [Candidatus Eisenbacteria bacterium]